MNASATMIEGPLGSTFHVLRADAETVAALAAVDWNRHFRRVSLDPVRGLVTLMAPSRLHDDLAGIVKDFVDLASGTLRRPSKGIGSTRLRRHGDPPDTGLELDCAFYVGECAEAYRTALMEGQAAADAFVERVGPDLAVEVEITSIDEGRIERYGQLGVRELWRLRGRKGSEEIRVDFLALRPNAPPRLLAASEVLDGLAPADVREAVEPIRLSRTVNERIEAVARIVRRRQRSSLRVREEAAPYPASPMDLMVNPSRDPS